jgi:hypothetical protein
MISRGYGVKFCKWLISILTSTFHTGVTAAYGTLELKLSAGMTLSKRQSRKSLYLVWNIIEQKLIIDFKICWVFNFVSV